MCCYEVFHHSTVLFMIALYDFNSSTIYQGIGFISYLYWYIISVEHHCSYLGTVTVVAIPEGGFPIAVVAGGAGGGILVVVVLVILLMAIVTT